MEWKYAQQKDYNKLKQDNVRLEWEYNKLNRMHEISITEAIVEKHTLKCEAIEFKEIARHAKEQHIIAQASLEILTLENRLLTTESKLLQQEVKKLTEENSNLEEELDKFKMENEQLQHELEDAKTKTSSLSSENELFTKKIDELTKVVEKIKSERDIIATARNELQGTLNYITNDNNKLRKETNELHVKIGYCNKKKLTEENSNLEEELDKFKMENEQLQHELEGAKTKTLSLSSENGILTKKIDELTKLVETIKSERDIIVTARNELQGTLNYITNDNNKLRKETNELHVKIALLQNSCTDFNDAGPPLEQMNDHETTGVDSVKDADSENSSSQSKRRVTFAETETSKKRVRVDKGETPKVGRKLRSSNRSRTTTSKMPDTTEPTIVIELPLEPVTKNPVL
ncbi:12432_t:CDS:10, partial [Gigaspora margarita]